jgi:HTH-type transcriptional regulator / antitoxin HigA
METLKYKVIKTDSQYDHYCDLLEVLVSARRKSSAIQDEIELLTLLIEKYDEASNTFNNADPVELLKSLMKDHQLKSVQLAGILNVSEGLISDMLHYKKGFSKETIRILSEKFKLSQNAFNRPYGLQSSKQTLLKVSSRRKTKKRQETT